MPAETTSFVGRRHELAEARKKLATARLISLTGPGGVGKTRLAIRIATDLGRGFSGGAWLAELAELQDPALVSSTVLAALDLRDQAAADPLALLRSYLKDKELLLVLDNCEHLLEAAAQFVSEVIQAAPGVRVIATSREPLSVAGEHVVPVPPLELPAPDAAEPLAQLRQNEAVGLFIERAVAASGHFELTTANQAAVAGLCRRLDGLPLAIELAAVRTRVLEPAQILDRLSDRFGLLTGGSRAALPRHQTLRTTIEWSYDLLTPAEQTLLTRLCAFAGRFTLDDGEQVCCCGDVPATDALDLLSSLIDKSLVIKEDTGGTACYRLHETMREYARLKLHQAGEEDAVERRCADYYLSRCGHFAAEGRYRPLEWLAWTDLEIDNIRAVLRRCTDHEDSRRGIALASSLIWYWITRATTEGVRWLDELLAREAEPAAHPWAYFVRGFLAVLQNDPAAATPALEHGVTAARAAGQQDALSQSLAMASIAANMAGDHASSGRLLDEARVAADGLDDLGTTLLLYQAQALNGLLDGNLGAVRSAASRGARLSREAGNLYSLGMMLLNQGFAALMSGDLRESGAAVHRRAAHRPPARRPGGAVPLDRWTGLLRGGVTRAAAGCAAVRSDGEPPRRSRSHHQRGNGTGTGTGRHLRHGSARSVKIRNGIQGRTAAQPRCRGQACARRSRSSTSRGFRSRERRGSPAARNRCRAASGRRPQQQGDRRAAIHLRAHRREPHPQHHEQARLQLTSPDRRMGSNAGSLTQPKAPAHEAPRAWRAARCP